jgi:hypothetical protein
MIPWIIGILAIILGALWLLEMIGRSEMERIDAMERQKESEAERKASARALAVFSRREQERRARSQAAAPRMPPTRAQVNRMIRELERDQ